MFTVDDDCADGGGFFLASLFPAEAGGARPLPVRIIKSRRLIISYY
ncbi:hypothetical protein [Streptomyces chilikensis]|nr:hypothetical protein [Streptomyces chilikensis]